MNNRDYKQFAEGGYYHIYNRGNGRMDIFRDGQDFKNFLKRLRLVLGLEMAKMPIATIDPKDRLRIASVTKNSFDIVCYCLMPNHFHFLIKQNTDLKISTLISRVCSSYSKYFNKKYGHVGNMYQDQFKAVRVDSNRQLLWLSAYIHQNPKVGGLVNDLKDYWWSSYLEFVNPKETDMCSKDIIVKQFDSLDKYVEFVDTSYEIIKKNKDRSLFLD